jgi:hypothetical protein
MTRPKYIIEYEAWIKNLNNEALFEEYEICTMELGSDHCTGRDYNYFLECKAELLRRLGDWLKQ